MKSFWHSWLLFGLFATAILSGMGWVTVRALQLNSENVDARRNAWLEESVRNALWQMDAALSPMILEEVSRPYSDYWAFNGQGEVFNLPDDSQVAYAQPSPLAVTNAVGRNLYFQAELPQKKGQKLSINSPQVVDEQQLKNIVQLNDFDIAANNDQFARLTNSITVEELQVALENTVKVEDDTVEQDAALDTASLRQQVIQPQQTSQQQVDIQLGNEQYGQRRSGTRKAMKNIQLSKTRLYNWGKDKVQMSDDSRNAETSTIVGGKIDTAALSGADQNSISQISEDMMRPFWIRDLLLLARKVEVGDKEAIQGVWLNWDSIKTQLLARVQDTFPSADLVKADPASEIDKSRLLASLPVKLVPGQPSDVGMPVAASLTFPITIAWIAVFAGVIAAGSLIVGISMLSERRGAFVSAVTHELRTPLTTFRMYTEMLAEGYVKDEDTRQEYVETLHRESERLGHLVENVLAYARLEKGTGSRTLEEVTATDLLARAGQTLKRRAEEAGMQLITDISDDAAGVVLKTDVTAVEQMLFNLVDNACKYAGKAEDRRIHVAVTTARRNIHFRVSDHGKGLQNDELRSVFKPFTKSAEKAAQSAPGVGLGLALCRRLARQLGGDISYEDHRSYGACFLLSLPRL